MIAIQRATQSLRSAGVALRERDDDDVLTVLGQLLAAWRDPDGPWQRSLAATLASTAGFSERNVREGLRRALADWDEAALRELVARELADRTGVERLGARLTSIACAGAIPMPTLLQIVLSLVVRSPALVKPASRDPVTAMLVAESLREIDAGLAACVAVVPIDTQDISSLALFLASECVVASGSDATIEAVRARLEPAQRFVGYGHRFSIAALGAEALGPKTAEAIALDVSLWDQLGCMSPAAIYAVGCGESGKSGKWALEDFASDLARALDDREQLSPLGEIDAASGALVRHERDEARMRFASSERGRLFEGEALRWTVVLEPDSVPRPSPLHRFVRIHPLPDEAALEKTLAPLAHQLSTVALADLDSRALPSLASARICPPGLMQIPPLGHPHDGQPLLLPLLEPL